VDAGAAAAGAAGGGHVAVGHVAAGHVEVGPRLDLEAPAGQVDVGAALVRRLAGVLPPDVRVRRVTVAPPGFDARFGALWRRYTYRLCDAPGGPDPLLRRHVVTAPRTLDVDAMAEAARGLLGEHDFAAYCRRREGATTVRTLLDLDWRREPGPFGDLIVAGVRADAFCHNQVRAMVGACLAVGEGRRDVGWPARVLLARVRDPRVTVAPAHGLTLEEVAYPEAADLAARATLTRRRRSLPERAGTPGEGERSAPGARL
jgi:tRNA pseudouridine38-40 synthase